MRRGFLTIGGHHRKLWACAYKGRSPFRRKILTSSGRCYCHGSPYPLATLEKDKVRFRDGCQACRVLFFCRLHYAAVTWICAVSLKTYFVEDNPTIRENLIGTLEELACVTAVGSAETENDGKAWLNLNREKWDLAIIDLFLKQGSGLGVLAACRDRLMTQKVVVLSNYATADIRQRCAQLGVDAVFDKSNEIDALVDFCLQQNGKAINIRKSSE